MISTFYRRLLSTVILWILVCVTVFSGHEVGFFALILLMGMTSLWEFYRMLDGRDMPNFKYFGSILGAIFFIGSFIILRQFGITALADFEEATLVGIVLLVFVRQMVKGLDASPPLASMAYTLFGLLYIVFLFNFMTKIVYVTPRLESGVVTGQFYVLYLMVVTKFSDMGAYVTGSLIGKHPMVPRISPKKTWEGFCGAIGFSLLGSFGMLWLLGDRLALLNPTHATVLGLSLGFAAVVGDLAESVVKRATAAKDSGGILPGIGGTLDLIDSLLFTAPLLFFYLVKVA